MRKVSVSLNAQKVNITSTQPGLIICSFAVRKGPNWLLAGILLLLWIIPGIMYLVVGGSITRSTCSIEFEHAGDGTKVTCRGDGEALKRAQSAVDTLPI
jgi:hypothetical protein